MKQFVSFAGSYKSARLVLAFALLLAVGTFGFYACKQKDFKEDVAPTNNLINPRNDKRTGSTYAEQVAYIETHLNVLGKATLLLAQDEAFRTKLYAEIEEQFDGDFNTLYQKLATSRGSDNILLGTKLNAKVQLIAPLSSLEAELQAFQNIEDSINVFPQVYIYNYQEHKEAGNLDAPFAGKNPVMIVHTGDTQTDPIGFTLNANNEIVTVNVPITEAYAESREVWIISLNERVNNNAHFAKEENNGRNDKFLHLNVSPKFEKMTVRQHKESWRAGKSDIFIVRTSTWRNRVNPFTFSQDIYWVGTPAFEGAHIRDFTRKQIRNQTEMTINWTYYQGWHAINGNSHGAKGDWCLFTIYEKDCWPTGLRESIVCTDQNRPNGQPNCVNHVFRSADSEYCSSLVSAEDNNVSNFANGFSFDNGAIKFNSKF